MGFKLVFIGPAGGVLTLFCWEWGIGASKSCPGGWSGLELTDKLQTCKIIDSIIEITMRTSWLCYQLSFTDNQIWCRDSFQEDIDMCQISLFCISINIVLQRWGGENPLFFRHRKPKDSS